MRPRISRKEAQYLLEVLLAQKPSIDAKRLRLEELRLDLIILRKRFLREGYSGFKEYKPAKQEYQQLFQMHTELFQCVALHDKLIQKYQAIANGEPHDGRYKHLSVRDAWYPKPNEVLQVLAT